MREEIFSLLEKLRRTKEIEVLNRFKEVEKKITDIEVWKPDFSLKHKGEYQKSREAYLKAKEYADAKAYLDYLDAEDLIKELPKIFDDLREARIEEIKTMINENLHLKFGNEELKEKYTKVVQMYYEKYKKWGIMNQIDNRKQKVEEFIDWRKSTEDELKLITANNFEKIYKKSMMVNELWIKIIELNSEIDKQIELRKKQMELKQKIADVRYETSSRFFKAGFVWGPIVFGIGGCVNCVADKGVEGINLFTGVFIGLLLGPIIGALIGQLDNNV